MQRRVFGLFVVAAALVTAADPPRKATPLGFRTIDGRQITLEGLRGKVVAVMFFSTDCAHCQRTATLLGPIYEQMKRRGLEICALAVNPSAAGNLSAFAKKYNVKFPVGLATRAEWARFTGMQPTAKAYVPHMVIIDRKGTVREDHPGAQRAWWRNQEANLRLSFAKYLKEPVS